MPNSVNDVYVVALTGGIASGKSTVSDIFESLGVQIVDTDLVAREIVSPNTPTYFAILEAFGHECLNENGTLNRKKLRQTIFQNFEKKTQLEAIMHPEILSRVRARLAEINAPYCIVVVPLLIETGDYSWVDRVLVVDAAPEDQLMRVIERDGIDRKAAESILANQAARSERIAFADDIILNDANKESLRAEIEALHKKYLQLSTSLDHR